MRPSILERLLVQDRPRRKMHDVGEFSEPVSLKHPVIDGDGPWVGTKSSGEFVQTKPSRKDPDGVITAFVKCPVAEEDAILKGLYPALWALSEVSGWSNRAASVEEGVGILRSKGLEPKAITVPYSFIKEVTGEELTQEDADRLFLTRGCVTEVQGVKVISAREALPDKSAIITTVPSLTGTYVRILDRLTVLLHRADTIILVR